MTEGKAGRAADDLRARLSTLVTRGHIAGWACVKGRYWITYNDGTDSVPRNERQFRPFLRDLEAGFAAE